MLKGIERSAMRFKKGNKVEVWNRREVLSGSWWSAEIISGNGHTYSVKYDGYPTNSCLAVDRVPRKAIRPCRPSEDLKELSIGDVVEVFDNNSWKLGEVLMIIDKKYCYMLLLDSLKELQVHKSYIRRQLSWEDNKWTVIHKDSGEKNDGKHSGSVRGGKSKCPMLQPPEKMKTKNNNFPMVLSKRMNKRKLDMVVPTNTCNGGRKKMAIMKDESWQRISESEAKVDNATSTGRLFGEKYINCYLNKRTGSSKIESGSIVPRSDENNYFWSSVNADADSTSSSVGSCSVDNSPCGSLQDHEEVCSHTDHAEASCSYVRDSSPSNKVNSQSEIHLLELSAYRSTLTAMYVSGPVSWEREAMLTNLRFMLNISNDEHSLELKELINSDMATYHCS
ncbi:uncharacterized protein LOC121995722 isoform X2 [Zingiber officinale]|uniref:ENT domain-containing protein n=1 Tax=Zingiber officinale TaxID=94328 RepID=A0A8J5FZG4_ZINOF|nr:uncharacterized protein LOC121995722 isoform X2 [Zingiber officinale]KAG6498740.1 hypothetical protein ZIOFF_038462 [Zingiber officinale]